MNPSNSNDQKSSMHPTTEQDLRGMAVHSYSQTAFLYVCACALVPLLSSCAQNPAPRIPAASGYLNASLPRQWQDIHYPAFEFRAPDPEAYRAEIAPGIIAYLVSDRTLPLIRASILFDEQDQALTPGDAAALSLLSSMYRKGGTAALTPQQLDDSLDFLSAGLSGSLGDYSSSISYDCLSRDFPALLSLSRDVFLRPRLDSARLEQQKALFAQGLAHRWDKPAGLLSSLYSTVLEQPHPTNWIPTIAEVQAVQQSDLIRLLPGRFQKKRVIVAISGDFNPDSMKVLLRGHFAAWNPDTTTSPAVPPLQFRNQAGVFLTDKKVSQANIRMGQPFVQRPNPDYYATSVASYILGSGGFGSRLTSRIRSDEGLAYSVYSFAESNYNHPGTAGVAMQTKVESASYAISLALEEIRRLAAEGPTPEELDNAKASLIATLPGMFDSPSATASIFTQSELLNRPLDHFRHYPQEISRITADDVRRVIAQWFDPAHMRIAVVGPAEALLAKDKNGQSLADFGPVTLVTQDSLDPR